MYYLTEYEEFLAKEIVDCAFKVHSKLGPGLLEKVYEIAFCHELCKKQIPFKKQVSLLIKYDGLEFDEGIRIDVLVDNLIVCELKSVETVYPIWNAQIISYLKLMKKHVGFRINFNVVLIKDGIKRFCIE